ncbi:MAG: hypothetical protein ACOYOV_13900 [Bacteroidales bacterium]
MTKKILLITFSLILCIKLIAQDLKNFESKRDTIVEYFNDGKIKAWYVQDSDTTSFMSVINKGIYNKMYGKYIPIDGTNEIIKIGSWTWFTNDGVLKDSVVYKGGAEIYRARFNNDGTLQLEDKSGLLVETNEIIEKCDEEYIIQFKHRNMTVLESMILPTYQEHGFYIVKNGVYDFIVNGKKYFQTLVLDITENGFYISQDWDFINGTQKISDSTFINIDSDLQIRLLSINKGVGGIPTKTKKEDYAIQIKKTDKYCRFQDTKFISKDGESIGHYYFTQYGLKNLKMKKGKPYMCENTGDYVLRRK